MAKPNKPKLNGFELKPLVDFLREYKDNHQIIVNYIDSLPTTVPIEERQRIYKVEVNKLKSKFSSTRQIEYESKSIELSVAHSCSSSSSGGTKNCGWKCVEAPVTGMYTSINLIRIEGTHKGISVGDDPAQACIKMTVSGKGKNKGTLFATFKYRPDYIISAVQKDSSILFNLVIENKNNLEHIDERKGGHLVYEEKDL